MRIGISAIEVSGDLLGGALIREFRSVYPKASFIGCGGDNMQREGLELICHIREIDSIGIIEVLARLIPLIRLRRRVMQKLCASDIDVFVGVDGPDFNGYIEKCLTAKGIACVHYVCPTVWVWRSGRARLFSAINRLILCLYPCEKKMIEDAGGRAEFVGHPLADAVPMESSQSAAQQQLAIADWINGRRVVSILPGSRSSEITRLLPCFLATARRLQQTLPLVFLVSAVDSHKSRMIGDIVRSQGAGIELKTIEGQMQQVIAAADLAIVSSGTASLETLLVKRPMIIGYKVHWLSYWLIRMLVKSSPQQQCCLLTGEPIKNADKDALPLVGQPNLLAGEMVVPEFLQKQLQPQAMAAVCAAILDGDNDALMARFAAIHRALAHNSACSAARLVTDLLVTES